jgi:hypothetical protein
MRPEAMEHGLWFGVSLGHIKAEHEKFTMNPGCAPGPILGDHPEDQISDVFRNTSSADLSTEPGNDAPIELKSSSVPPDDGVRKHDDEKLLPAGPDLTSGDPEQFVEQGQSRPWMPTLKNCELLSER